MRTTTKTFILLAVVAVLAIGGPLAFVLTRPEKKPEPGKGAAVADVTKPQPPKKPCPFIESYTLRDVEVTAGQSTDLAWATGGGTSATVTDLLTGAVSSVPVNGQITVTPASTRGYRLTVSGACEDKTQHATQQDIFLTVRPR